MFIRLIAWPCYWQSIPLLHEGLRYSIVRTIVATKSITCTWPIEDHHPFCAFRVVLHYVLLVILYLCGIIKMPKSAQSSKSDCTPFPYETRHASKHYLSSRSALYTLKSPITLVRPDSITLSCLFMVVPQGTVPNQCMAYVESAKHCQSWQLCNTLEPCRTVSYWEIDCSLLVNGPL